LRLKQFIEENDAQLLADLLGVHIRTVDSWRKGIRRPAPEMAAAIEKATLGKVTLREALFETQTVPRTKR